MPFTDLLHINLMSSSYYYIHFCSFPVHCLPMHPDTNIKVKSVFILIVWGRLFLVDGSESIEGF